MDVCVAVTPAMVILLSVCGVAVVLLLCLCVCLCKCFVCTNGESLNLVLSLRSSPIIESDFTESIYFFYVD